MDYTVRELEKWNVLIENMAKEVGLDFYPQEFEIIGYNEMLSYEAYVGMPSRYPHWSYGKAYEKNRTLYSLNLTGLPYEMVINSNPSLAYLMKDNTLLLQILTMAHVYGHNDFFKNNRLFKEGTDADHTLEMFKLDAETVRRYINNPSIGYQRVERVLDAAHAIRYQISRVIGEKKISQSDQRRRLIEDYSRKVESKGILDSNDPIEEPNLSKIPLSPEDDLLQFIIDYGDLEDWEKSLLTIVRRETLYFLPQIETKTMNEGWASFWHYNILKKLNLPQELHFEFLKRHNDVVAPMLGGLNPYYIGFRVLEDIEKRYGRDKIFEVRAIERDNSFLRKYLTEELCAELNLFQYAKKGFDYVVDEVADESGWKKIRDTIATNTGVGSIPYIRVIDLNRRDNTLTLEHVFDGRELDIGYAKETLKYVQELWGYKVVLVSKTKELQDISIVCDETKKITTK
ncbi:stage V sporulation protein R [Clostridium zeae]|uniref:Stage V sporulation protein R n=1 Tax=Clostridium zeae TaxID=2759022 RepID=A0ABQ1EIJ7_9CLOT|nr:SpoVR family protein [Clostridium zeae]GFZ34368.1 stage V sporulation protein R [Clostridium zeae]